MPLWPLPGGAVDDPSSDQNFLSLAASGGELEADVEGIEITPSKLSTSSKELFPQLVTPGPVHINYGEATVEWAGATRESKAKEVTHGLGTTPASILLTAKANGEFISVPVLGTVGATKFSFIAWVFEFAEPAAGKKQTFYWQAIG